MSLLALLAGFLRLSCKFTLISLKRRFAVWQLVWLLGCLGVFQEVWLVFVQLFKISGALEEAEHFGALAALFLTFVGAVSRQRG